MTDSQSVLFVPLHSNAYGLVAGAPAARLRRRLKNASLVFDHVILEAGVLRIHAGPGGSAAFLSYDDFEQSRFQASRQRRRDQAGGFVIGVGDEQSPGVPALVAHTVVESKATISWEATYRPFADELPAKCDWIGFAHARALRPANSARAAEWQRLDDANEALRAVAPEAFVRAQVVKSANQDLAMALQEGVATSLDSLHRQVVSSRFHDEVGWRPRGFALPILFPAVGGLDWPTIGRLRRTKDLQRFRHILQEVEVEALEEVHRGDVEAAAHHAYERYLAAAVHVEPFSGVAGRATVNLIVGTLAGLATVGITGPTGPLTGAAIGTGVSALTDARSVMRRRREAGWVGVHQALTSLDL